LQDQLFNAIEETCRQDLAGVVQEKTGFIPRQQQVKILTENVVAEELARIEKSFKKRIQVWKWPLSQRRIEEDASIICDGFSRHLNLRGDDKQKAKCFRKIFAILLLIDEPGAIRKFIDEGVCDADLPLKKYETTGKHAKTFSFCRWGAPGVSLKCFERWKGTSLAQFERYQWKLLAPWFSRGEEARHYIFQDEVILPFTYKKHAHNGAHGEVFQVRIHPEHHDFNESKVSLSLTLGGTGYLRSD
jgi:hypothetical protein